MAVPETAEREGDIRARGAWAEPSVWMPRMLTIFENGVKGDGMNADRGGGETLLFLEE